MCQNYMTMFNKQNIIMLIYLAFATMVFDKVGLFDYSVYFYTAHISGEVHIINMTK